MFDYLIEKSPFFSDARHLLKLLVDLHIPQLQSEEIAEIFEEPEMAPVESPRESQDLSCKEQAQKVFWGLGKRFWMQIIDGEYHYLGPMVFDKGLHGRAKEEGFFPSLKTGCKFASEHLTQKLTLAFYKELHKRLCAHFKGIENNTLMSAPKIGLFRHKNMDKALTCKFNIKELGEAREHYLIVWFYELCQRYGATTDKDITAHLDCIETYRQMYSYPSQWAKEKQDYWMRQTQILAKLKEEYQKSKNWVEDYEKNWGEKVEKINRSLSDLCKKLSIEEFVLIVKQDAMICVCYSSLTAKELEAIVKILFNRYNIQIEEINLQLHKPQAETQIKKLLETKIAIIAELFQLLEWLHPFHDGQGRTDLVLLAKLLSEEGFNPPILNKPYTSSYTLFSEWQEYLLKGIKIWKERAKSTDSSIDS